MSYLRFAFVLAAAALVPAQQPGVSNHLAAARAAESSGDLVTAEHEYQLILQLARDPDVLLRLGLVRHLQNKFAAAIPALEEAVRLKPGLWAAQLFLGIDLYRTNNFEQALSHLKAAERIQSEHPETRFWLGATYIALKQNFEGLGLLEDLLRDQPRNTEVVRLLAQTYASLGAQLMNGVAERYPDTAAGYLVHGQALELEGAYDAAIEAYRTALTLQPGRPGVHAAIAGILLREGKKAQAEQELQRERSNP